MSNIWIALCVCFGLQLIHGLAPNKRFEYKLSFKGPHLVQRDGTIPFWEHGGHAIASDESIRITPSLRSKRGYVWTREVNTKPHWEVEMVFKVNGRGRIGADGLAFWYTASKGVEGPVFGSNDQWTGLGVFFDSFDNDGQHNNPYIMAMTNDGTLMYDHNSDGSSQQLGGCLRDFRNKPFPVRVKVEYYQKALTIFFHTGMTNNPADYELCMRIENVELPVSGYFGISGATGGLADDHDVLSFITHSLQPPTDLPDMGKQVSEEERLKFEQEYEEYRQRLDKAKDDYRKEHPDRKDPEEEDDYFESQDIRELKMIFEGQNSIHETVRILHHKLDEMLGKQDRTLSQVSMISQNQGGQQPPQGNNQGQQQQQLPYIDTIKRHEVDSLMQQQRDLTQNARDIRSFVNDIQAKMQNLQQQVNTAIGNINAGGGGGGGAEVDPAKHQELINRLNSLQSDVKNVVNRPAQGVASCPPSNCITTFTFLLMLAAQAALFIGYSMYKSNREAAAKKFY